MKSLGSFHDLAPSEGAAAAIDVNLFSKAHPARTDTFLCISNAMGIAKEV